MQIGLIYLFKNNFMPYHYSETISLQWHEVDSSTQYLFLAFIRAVFGGGIATANVIEFL